MNTPISTLTLLLSRMSRCMPHLVRAAGNRRELALLELREAAAKSVFAMFLAFGAAFFLCLAFVSLTILVAAIYWDTPHRVLAISIVVGVQVIAAIVCAVWVWATWRRRQFFQSTLEQMERDGESMSRMFEKTEAHL